MNNTEHRCYYNAPTTNEVAVVNQECDKRDMVIRTRHNRLHRTAETQLAYDALQYPLMFCRRENGYHCAWRLRHSNTGRETYKNA